jgi:AcrR family transcriptional regulator
MPPPAAARRNAGPPPVRGGKRSRRRPRALGLDAIVEVTLELIDREGVDAVSMRRVADEFDTGPASLYAYVANKQALLRLALDRVIDAMPAPEGDTWQELARDFVRKVRAGFAAHSDIARLSFAHVPTSRGTIDNGERMLRAMIEGGVPPQVAAWSMDIMALYVAADVYEGYLLAQRFDDGSGRDPEEIGSAEFVANVTDAFAALSPEEYPYLTKHAAEMVGGSGDDRFYFGVDMLIAGFAAQIPTKPRPGRRSR